MLKLKQSTARNIMLKMYLSSDHITEATGKTLTVTASKDGGTFAAVGGTVTEVSNGWYKVALTTTDTNTLGTLIIRATAASCDASEHPPLEIVAFDSQDAAGLGLSRIDAAISTRSTYAGADTAGTTTLLSRIASALTITGGKVDVNDKTGFSLSSLGIQAIWDALTSALTTVGSIGKLFVDNVDATISSRSTYAGGAVASVTGNVGGNVAGSVGSVTAAVTVGTNNDKTDYALTAAYDAAKTAASPSEVQTKVDAALDAVGTELSAVPTTTGTLRQKINWVFEYFRNRRTVTATTETLYKEDASTSLGTSTVSDDGVTFDKGEMS